MKAFGWVLIVVGIVGIAGSTAIGWTPVTNIRTFRSEREQLKSEYEVTKTELFELNTLYRGYNKSIPLLPDSMKMAQSGIISARMREYNKQIRLLEMTQFEQKRQIVRRNTKIGEQRTALMNLPVPVGIAGIVLLSIGLLIRNRST